MERWTDKRRLFLEKYFACNMNATEAARQSGYKHPNVQGPVLVNIGIIRNAINKRLGEMAMPANEVLSRLGDIARADITDFIDDTGGIDFKKVKKKGHLVKEVIHQKGHRSTIKLHDAQAVLMHLDKHHGGPSKGAIPQEIKHSGTVGVQVYIPDNGRDDRDKTTSGATRKVPIDTS